MVILKEFFEKVDFEKISRRQKCLKKLPSMQRLNGPCLYNVHRNTGIYMLITYLNSFLDSDDLSSADNLCKQFGSRSEPTECQSWSASKPLDTPKVFMKEFLKEMFLKKSQQTTTKAVCKVYQETSKVKVLTHEAPPIYNLQQTTISNFAANLKITNKACYFMRIVCWQTILVKYHTLFFENEEKCRKICRLLQSWLVL